MARRNEHEKWRQHYRLVARVRAEAESNGDQNPFDTNLTFSQALFLAAHKEPSACTVRKFAGWACGNNFGLLAGSLAASYQDSFGNGNRMRASHFHAVLEGKEPLMPEIAAFIWAYLIKSEEQVWKADPDGYTPEAIEKAKIGLYRSEPEPAVTSRRQEAGRGTRRRSPAAASVAASHSLEF